MWGVTSVQRWNTKPSNHVWFVWPLTVKITLIYMRNYLKEKGTIWWMPLHNHKKEAEELLNRLEQQICDLKEGWNWRHFHGQMITSISSRWQQDWVFCRIWLSQEALTKCSDVLIEEHQIFTFFLLWSNWTESLIYFILCTLFIYSFRIKNVFLFYFIFVLFVSHQSF